jgi:hypothetical protein
MQHSRRKPSRQPAVDDPHICPQNFGSLLLPLLAAIVMAYFSDLLLMSETFVYLVNIQFIARSVVLL